MKKGITVAGSILVDKINVIDGFPKSGELTQIRSLGRAAGGCVPNVGIDLKKIRPELDVYACGRVGADDEGEFVKQTLKAAGVDVGGVVTDGTDKTSFTEVMSVRGGERTFFTYAGASAAFGLSDMDFGGEQTEMLHLGYFLLLDKVDGGDGLEILKRAKAAGVKTSIDMVSENSDRYSVIAPCLAYTDNLIVNEIEAGKIAGIEPTAENIRKIAEKLKSFGVKERVIIHCPAFGACFDGSVYTKVDSYRLPDGYIKGTTGAGDAFCAGALAGIYYGYGDEKILRTAAGVAAASLSAEDATSGVVSERETEKLIEKICGKK